MLPAWRLVRRFVASVLSREPGPHAVDWVRRVLTPGEFEVWSRQPRYDRTHSLGVARRVEAVLGERSEDRWLAAALLHDVGKVESRLGILGRVIATLTMSAVGRDRVRSWSGRRGWRGRFGRYADHGQLGGSMVRDAGGREDVARWAEVHHRLDRTDPAKGTNLPPDVVLVLRDEDRD